MIVTAPGMIVTITCLLVDSWCKISDIKGEDRDDDKETKRNHGTISDKSQMDISVAEWFCHYRSDDGICERSDHPYLN
ncbi:unnamed protein product [Prunus armeniaca]|uniref:Uncharacterized protein n=1 Tax=Prunus armeniaca TaxID=36596 RepID=A0A6J5VU65_PRUAR|nr:unnamed protein product [Prunus armeniaca]CAB4292476.1 unnamed protein product [Prunus armeniaca]